MNFKANQIVKGARCGTFVILGFRNIGGEQYAQLKPVNPHNHAEHGHGELALPLDAIRPLDTEGQAAAKAEAVANADAHTNNAALPTYSELVTALRHLSHPMADDTDLDDALALLGRVHNPLDANAVDPVAR